MKMKITPQMLEGRRSREMLKNKDKIYHLRIIYNKCFSLLRLRVDDPIFYLKTKAEKIRMHIENHPGLSFPEKIYKINRVNDRIVLAITNEVTKIINRRDHIATINNAAINMAAKIHINSVMVSKNA